MKWILTFLGMKAKHTSEVKYKKWGSVGHILLKLNATVQRAESSIPYIKDKTKMLFHQI